MLAFYGILVTALVAAGAALAVFRRLHWTTFVATVAAALLLPLPVNAIGLAIAKEDQQTFHEYWNGYETRAYAETVACERDGRCVHTYNCDPYTVWETEYYTDYETRTAFDSDGKLVTRSVPVQKSRQVQKTRYHSCPYSTQETSYYVESTLKTFTIARALMTGEQYRGDSAIPGGRVTSPPELWRQAEARIAAGTPGGVTTVNEYKNFVLTAETPAYKHYSTLIEELRTAGQLPEVAKGLSLAPYTAQKLSFVGPLPHVDREKLSQELTQLNGALGTELRGDLHVVLVDTTTVKTTPEDYAGALVAYWKSPKIFGRDALGKNALVLVVGVKGSPASSTGTALPAGTPVVAWAQAATGMPVGNERLLRQLGESLLGVPVTKNFLGTPTYNPTTEQVTLSEGAVERILWGPNKFERVSMTAKDESDAGPGFAYLSDRWQPDAGTLAWIYGIGGLLAALALAGGILISWTLRSNGRTDLVRNIFIKRKV